MKALYALVWVGLVSVALMFGRGPAGIRMPAPPSLPPVIVPVMVSGAHPLEL